MRQRGHCQSRVVRAPRKNAQHDKIRHEMDKQAEMVGQQGWCIAEVGQNPLNYNFLCDASRIDWTAKAVPLVGPCPTPCVAKRNSAQFSRELLLGTSFDLRAERCHCIDLITVRFRPVSGFTSANKADWSMQSLSLLAKGQGQSSASSVCHRSASLA